MCSVLCGLIHASGTSAPGPSSTLADKTEDQKLISLKGMSVSELADKSIDHGTPQKRKYQLKKVSNKRALSSSSSTDSDAEHKVVQVQIAVKLNLLNCWYAR